MVSNHDGIDGIFRSIVINGQIVGTISIEQQDGSVCKNAQIGYFLCTDQWSRGITTEAVRQICDHAFAALDITSITGLVFEPNWASRRVLEKNSFILKAIIKNAAIEDRHLKDTNPYDLCIYEKFK